MRQIRTLLLLLCIAVIFCSFVNAADFEVIPTVITDRINMLQVAEFELKIANNQNTSDKFLITSPDDTNWRVYSDPLSDIFTGTTIEAHESHIVHVYIKPSTGVKLAYGLNIFSFSIKSEKTGVEVRRQLYVTLFSGEQPEYATAVTLNVSPIKPIDPRKTFNLEIKLKNRNVLEIDNLTIRVQSELAFLEAVQTMSLKPLEEKTIIIPITLDPLEQATKTTLSVAIFQGDNTIYALKNVPVEIIGYANVEKKTETKKSFLKTEQIITLFNNGNMPTTEIVKIETNSFTKLFTVTSPKAFIINDNGKTYLAWEITLASQERNSLKVSENYRYFIAVIFIIIISFFLYYLLRSPVIIKKRAVVTELKEGGISELKVILNVINRGKHVVENMKIVDVIPNIAEIDKSFEVGTLRPDKLTKHELKGTIVTWKIDRIERFEERVITYKVKSRLTILGWFKLPHAVVKYIISGKEYIHKSNKIKLDSVID